MNEAILAIDIGASKIASGLAYPDGSMESINIVPTNAKEGGESVIRRVIEICKPYIDKSSQDQKQDQHKAVNFSSIGVSSAGQIDTSTGKVIFATENMPGWTGMLIKKRLEDAFGLDTSVENDVNCLALGEAYHGAGQGYKHLLFLAVGTGIGGAIIIDGKLYRGWKGSAGELGHISIDYKGRKCNCGSRGCIETYASGPAIEKDYRRNFKRKGNPEKISCKEITKLAQCGDAYAIKILESAGSCLGTCLFGLLNLLNPEAVILGGGVLESDDIYLNAVRKVVAEQSLGPMRTTPILRTKLKGNIANMVGAAVFCRQRSGS